MRGNKIRTEMEITLHKDKDQTWTKHTHTTKNMK